MPLAKAFTTSNSQAWATPWAVLDALKPEFNFTLDAAACAHSAKAPKFFTEEDDAFTKDWYVEAGGGDVWCNPPYGKYRGKSIGDWIMKGWKESWKRMNVVFLLPCNKQDQEWFHEAVLPCAEIRPVKGRIQFVDPLTGKPPLTERMNEKTGLVELVRNGNSQGSMLVIFGPNYYPKAPKSFRF